MTDHLEILITHGRHHQSRIHPSEMNRSFLEGGDTDAASSSMENHATRNGSPGKAPGKAPSFPSSPTESTDHYDDRSLDDIFSETVSIENSGFLDRFAARKRELLMRLEEQRHLGERNEEGRSAGGLELQLLKDSQLQQMETIQVAIKEQLLRENAIKFSEMLNDLDEAHKKEVQELCKKHEEQVQQLRDQIDEMESPTRLEQLKRLHGFNLERKDTEQDRGRLTDMWITEPMDMDRDEELILLRADHSKKIDELTSKFRNEVATLSVKLESTKRECEQRVKQTQMLEKLFSQEKAEKLELLKKTELQSQQIVELMERLNGMETSEERPSQEEEDVRGKMDDQSRQIADLIMKLEEQQREEAEKLAELRQRLDGEMDLLRRDRDEAVALSRGEVEMWKVKAQQVEHELQELREKMDEEKGSLELSRRDRVLPGEDAEDWKVRAEQVEQRMQKLGEQLEDEKELLLASWKSKVELSEEQVVELRQQLADKESLLLSNDKELELAKEDAYSWKKRAEDVEEITLELKRQLEEGESLWKSRDQELMLATAEVENWKRKVDEVEEKVLELRQRLEESGSHLRYNGLELEEETDLLQKNNDQNLVEAESWKGKAELSEEKLSELRQQLEEKESLLRKNEQELALSKEETVSWKTKGEEMEVWKAMAEEAEQQHLIEMENWRKSFEQKSRELEELRESFELSRVELEESRRLREVGDRTQLTEKDYVEEYEQYLEHVEDRDGEISVLQDELREREAEVMQLRQLVKRHGIRKEKIANEDLQLFFDTEDEDDDDKDEEEPNEDEAESDRRVEGKNTKSASDDLGKTLTRPSAPSEDARTSEDSMINVVSMELLRHFRPKALFERAEDETELEALRREITSFLKEWQDSRKTNSVEDAFRVPDVEKEELEEALNERKKEMEMLQAEVESLRAVINEGLEAKSRLAEMEEELEGLKVGMEDRINEELVKQQSDMQLQKLVELEEIKTQLEEIDKRKESEMRNEYEESVRNLKDQYQQETTAKNEQIKEMSAELFKKSEEVNRLKARSDELEQSSLHDPVPILPDTQDGVLVSMLQADLSRMNVERNSMQQTNNQLMVILSDMVRVSLETERRITHCLSSAESHPLAPAAPLPPFGGTRDNGTDGRHGGNGGGGGATFSGAAEAPYNPRDGLRRGGHNILDEEVTNLHDMSMASDEGLDVSQRFMETLFAGPELDADSEEVITDSSNRLQRAVDRLLDQIEETGRQLREAQRTRTELLASVQERLRTMEELTARCSELDNLLTQETRSREFLALELYKAEGLVQGYAAEKQAADECIRSLEETKESLARDLERTRLKLKEKVEKESDVGQREQDLAHQRHALELSVGEKDKGLLQENTQLTEEVRRLKLKLEDETHVHENRLREAESTNEELGAVIDRITDERNVAEEDYQHKIEALEKQMKYDKQFHEEQTIEREQERDDYQSKIDKLELLLRNKGRQESAHNHLNDEIQELEDQLRAKTEGNAELRRKTETLERELSSHEITIHELREFTRSLESELDDRLKKEHVLEERIVDLETELDKLHDLSQSSEAAGQKESEFNENLRQMQKTIHDLEGEVDKLLRSEQTLLLRNKQLEDEVRNLKSLQEELMQDKEALQTQVCAQLKLVSSLRAQVEDLSLGHDQQTTSEVVALRQKLEEEKEASSRREKELSDLSDQLDQFRDQMMELHTNLSHAQAELEVAQTEKRNLEAEKDSNMKQHLLEKERMKTEMKVLRNDASLAQSMPLLSQTLINEKNEEIDQMTRELNELREYVLKIETNVLSRETHEGRVDLEQLMSDANMIQSMPLLARALLKEKDKMIDRIKRELLEQEYQDRERRNLLTISHEEDASIEVQRNDAASLTQSRPLVSESLLNEKEETINQLTKEVSELRDQVSRLERTDASNTTQEEQERATSKETLDERSQTLTSEGGGELSTSMPEVERHQSDDTRERHLFDTTDFGALLTKSRNSTNLSLAEACSLEEDSGTSLMKMNERLAESSEQLNDILQEKENTIEDLTTRAQSLQNENDNLTEYSVNLEADFDRVQKMVEEKQKEVEALNQELYVSQTKVKTQVENYDVIQLVVQEKQNEIDGLNERLQELSTLVADKQKEIELLTEELYTTQSHAQTRLQKELRERQNVIDEKEEEMEELMQQLEKKDEIERELMRVKQLLENEKKSVEQKNKDIATLREQQIDAMQLKSTEEKTTSLRLKELETTRDELSDRLSHSEQLVSSLTKTLDEERLKVEVEQNEQVTQSRVTKERHVMELAEQRSKLESELSEQLAEVRRVMKEEHAQEIGSLMARYEEDLELLKRQEPVDDEEDDRSLHEAVDNNEQLDASFINDSLEQLSGNLESILKKLHSESVRVLSLSDIQFLRGLEQRHFDLARAEAAWKDEKASLVAAIQALKQLLLDTSQTTDARQLPGGGSEATAATMDWRSDILKAVHKVFAKDKELLRADLQTYRVIHPNENQTFLELLEKTMKDQEARHRDGLDQLITIDRQSLVDEVHDLLQKNNALTRDVKQEREKVVRNAQQFEDECLQKDWELKHEVETIEMKLKQEKLLNEDLQSQLSSEQARVAEMTAQLTRVAEMAAQLSRERHASGDQQFEVNELQTELTKARGLLGREQAQVQSLSLSLAEEQRKVAELNGNVVQGQVELEQSQQKLESERSMAADVQKRLTSAVERLEMDLDAERQRHRETKTSLMDHESTVGNLEREMETLREQIHIQESQSKVRLVELETSMNAAGTRSTEFMDLLEKERRSNSDLRQTIDHERESQRTVLLRFQNTIADLQANLDVERSKILELTSRLERDRCKAMVIEEEKGQVEETLTAEAAVSSQLRQNIKTLTAQKQDMQMELQSANQQLSVLQIEHSRLQSSLSDSRTALETHEVAAKSEHLFRADQERQSDRRKILELESQVQVARQAAARLEQELSLSRKNEMNALEESRVTRLRSHNSPRVTFNSSTKDGPPSTPPPSTDKVDGALPTPISETLTIYQKQLETFQQRLQLLAIRLQEEMADASIRPSRENVAVDVRSEEQSLKKLLTELTSLNSCITSDSLPSTGASIILSIIPALNDKILRHNSELTSYISRLTSEKQDLREIVSELQRAIAVLKDKEKRFNEVEDVEDQFASERVKWSRDASSMSLELSNARQESARLRADLRRAEIDLEREREKYFSPAAAGELNFPADKEKIQRLYGKYLRADCARKSLIYQKKYLLLLLGGFQDCEEATLAAIARMGAFPSSSDGDVASTIRNRPLSRFRTAANVVVAISRLKFLVNKWRRATRIGTPVMGGFTQILPGSTYVPSSVNGFATTPLRSHSLSNVHRAGSLLPVPLAAASNSFESGDRPSHPRVATYGWTASGGGPRSIAQTTPPTKDRSKDQQPRHSSSGALSASNTTVFRSTLAMNTTPTRPTTMTPVSPSLRHDDETSTDSLNTYLQRVERIQQNLTAVSLSTPPSNITFRK